MNERTANTRFGQQFNSARLHYSRQMTAQFQVIIVPSGREYQAVCKGLPKGDSPRVVPVPLGKGSKEYLKTINIKEESILVMGVAGSLSPRLDVGDIVSYTSCCFCQLIKNQLTCTPYLNEKIKQVEGLTSERVICTASEKKRLSQYAQVVDMESYYILEKYQDKSVSVLRVISDNYQQNIPEVNQAINEKGELNPYQLAIALIKQPLEAAHLIYGSLKALQRLELITREIFTQ